MLTPLLTPGPMEAATTGNHKKSKQYCRQRKSAACVEKAEQTAAADVKNALENVRDEYSEFTMAGAL